MPDIVTDRSIQGDKSVCKCMEKPFLFLRVSEEVLFRFLLSFGHGPRFRLLEVDAIIRGLWDETMYNKSDIFSHTYWNQVLVISLDQALLQHSFCAVTIKGLRSTGPTLHSTLPDSRAAHRRHPSDTSLLAGVSYPIPFLSISLTQTVPAIGGFPKEDRPKSTMRSRYLLAATDRRSRPINSVSASLVK
jgi:hypothetical protein